MHNSTHTKVKFALEYRLVSAW